MQIRCEWTTTGSFTQLEEVDIDFRVSGLPHAVVKQAENSRVRELVNKIESHPHRQDLQADLQQSNAYNPFSEKSKKMIQDIGNVELFELCETIPKVQCSECLLHWNQGCTCGHLLRENQSSRSILRWTLDLLSIPNYVIKKGRPRGHRFGKTKEQKDHHIVHFFWKRCIKRGFEGIHDRFQNDSTFRESLLSIDRTEEVCIQMDKDAQTGFTYRMSQDEYFRNKKLVDLSQHIWTQLTDETPFRLQRSINKIAPSSPWVWRRATRTDSFLAIPEFASDASVWLPTGFGTMKIFQQPGQADHDPRAMPARLDSEVTHKCAALHSQWSLCFVAVGTYRLCSVLPVVRSWCSLGCAGAEWQS